jgi:seryl-tRNA synthetase
MLDIRLIRSEPDAVRASLARRDPAAAQMVDTVLELDERWRGLTTELEQLRSEQNAASKALRGAPSPEQREQLAALAARGRALSDAETLLRAERDEAMRSLPNLPQDDAPAQDTVLREVGDATKTGRDHLELAGPRIDMERGARLSGSRFAYLRGELVLLELALVNYAMRKLVREGFEPVIPPVLVREPALYGTGYFPDTEQQIYHLPADDLYLVGTSEVALASLHADEILDAEQLPLRYAGFSSCFRREAGAAGKDTRGIFRVHQFDKVEMFTFCEPDAARDEHQRLLAIEESIMADLEIPYRVVAIAIDDLGASAAMKYDIEAWLPGQGRHRELTSTSNTTDFQARRLDIRYRPNTNPPSRPVHVATLNGTAVAVGRTIIALLENGQRDDGSVRLPPALTAFGAPEILAPAPERSPSS